MGANFSHAPKPEPKTGYVNRKVGSEHCFSCEHFVKSENKGESGCNGPKMKALSTRPRLPNGDVKVHPVAWCKFWEKQ
jgi:hypothetical protein